MDKHRHLPPTFLHAFLLLMAALHFILPGLRLLTPSWRLLGLLPFLVGVALNLTADRAFTEAGTTVKPFEESSVLLTKGPFAVSRHPMYLGMTLILLGIAILLGSLTPIFLVPLFAAAMHVVFVRGEERMLEDRFGRAWLTYKGRVRPWL